MALNNLFGLLNVRGRFDDQRRTDDSSTASSGSEKVSRLEAQGRRSPP